MQSLKSPEWHDSKNSLRQLALPSRRSVRRPLRPCTPPLWLLQVVVPPNCQRPEGMTHDSYEPRVKLAEQLLSGPAIVKIPVRRVLPAAPRTIPGDDLLSRLTHYHGPRLLNGRVRNGNGCFQPGLLTGKLLAAPLGAAVEQRGSGKGCSLHRPVAAGRRGAPPVVPAEQGINAAKRSAVSTG